MLGERRIGLGAGPDWGKVVRVRVEVRGGEG